jgi:hypothetical protein
LVTNLDQINFDPITLEPVQQQLAGDGVRAWIIALNFKRL